jgi:hypothetical protein
MYVLGLIVQKAEELSRAVGVRVGIKVARRGGIPPSSAILTCLLFLLA